MLVQKGDAMIRVWGRTDSSNVQAVMWCLAELGLEVERIDAGHRFGVVDTAEYRAMNPNGTVPTLMDGDGPPLWESGAILRYLAGAYGPETFWPADPFARADVDRWAEWAKINVAMKFTAPVFWRVVRTAPSRQDPTAIAAALDALSVNLQIAESRLAEHPFLVGEALTLADIQFGHCLYRYFDMDIARPDLPHLNTYYARLADRPAYRAHVMVSYEALRVSD